MDRADGCPGKVDSNKQSKRADEQQRRTTRTQNRDYLLSRIELGDLGSIQGSRAAGDSLCPPLFQSICFYLFFSPLVRLRCRNDVLLSSPRLVVLIRRIIRLGAKTRLAGLLFQTKHDAKERGREGEKKMQPRHPCYRKSQKSNSDATVRLPRVNTTYTR